MLKCKLVSCKVKRWALWCHRCRFFPFIPDAASGWRDPWPVFFSRCDTEVMGIWQICVWYLRKDVESLPVLLPYSLMANSSESCKIPSLWWMSNLHHDRKITPPLIKTTFFLWHCRSFPAQADNNTALTFATFHLGYLQFPRHPCGWKFLKLTLTLTWWAIYLFFFVPLRHPVVMETTFAEAEV